MRKIVIANNKGRVSTTTTAYNLGSYFAKKGYKVLMVDCDPQGNLSDALGINSIGADKTLFDVLKTGHSREYLVPLPQYKNFHLIVSNLETEEVNMALSSKPDKKKLLLNALEELEHEFDICVIDTSPTLSLLTLNALVASDSIYIPLIAGFFELKGLGVLTNAIDAIRKSLRMVEIKGIFLTQVEKRQNFTKESSELLAEQFESNFLNTWIRKNTDLKKAAAEGQDIFTFNPNSNGAKDYEDLALEILEREGLNG